MGFVGGRRRRERRSRGGRLGIFAGMVGLSKGTRSGEGFLHQGILKEEAAGCCYYYVVANVSFISKKSK